MVTTDHSAQGTRIYVCRQLLTRYTQSAIHGCLSSRRHTPRIQAALRSIEGAHTILSGDLVLSGAIWWKGVSQRPPATLGGGLSQGRWQRLIGAAFLFLYGEGVTSLDNKRMARGRLIIGMHMESKAAP